MAQNIEHKKSVLDDDASIYRKKEEREESKTVKERWAEMNGAERKQYFKDYMLKPILFGGFIIILIVYFLYTSFRDGRSNKFFLAVLNQYYLDNEAMEKHLETLEEYWEFGKREQAVYSTDITLSDSAAMSTFMTYLYAGNINAAIGTKEQLEKYGYYFVDFKSVDALDDVLSQLPEEALCPFTYETQTPNPEDSSVTTTYSGIYLKYTIFADNLNKDFTVGEDDLILVIPLSGIDDKDGINYSYDFLKYALGIELGE